MPTRIRLARVYDLPPAPPNPFLIDRTWPRGIAKGELPGVRWLKEVAPSNELRRWLHDTPERWPSFCQVYWQQLAAHPQRWQPLLEAARHGGVTLLTADSHGDYHHAQVLRQFLETQLATEEPGVILASPVCYSGEFAANT